MAHRFLHTLVFSSVLALEGCSTSHSSQGDLPDGGMPDAPNPDAFFDAGPRPFDTGPARVDAGPPPFDGGSTNVDSGAPDAGRPTDPRLCEPGWQTTKASTCQPIDMNDPDSPLICYSSFICEPVMNDAGELVEECREWEPGDGGCILPRSE
ncbi:MAG: hypothetical protein AB8H86_23465 [Polyangiales bacterium]